MRISTSQLYRDGTQAILSRQAEAAKLQQQLATGNRILNPSDDPIGSARLLALHEQVAANDQYQRNLSYATGRLNIEESTLAAVGDTLQRVRELTIHAHNGILSEQDRHAIAQEVRQLHDHLLGLANTKDGNGEYLFAGYKTRTQPFVVGGGGQVAYQGDQGQRLIQVGPSLQIPVGDSGAEVFQSIRSGNGSFSVAANASNTGSGTIAVGSVVDPASFRTHSYRVVFSDSTTYDVIDDTMATSVLSNQLYVDGQAIQFDGLQTAISGTPAAGDSFTIQPATAQDVFSLFSGLVDDLEQSSGTPASNAQLSQSLDNAIAELDQGLEHFSMIRSRIGSRLNGLESQDQSNQDFGLHLQETIADVGDLDYAQAASQLSEKLLALQGAQQSFLRIQNLSLFNYMS